MNSTAAMTRQTRSRMLPKNISKMLPRAISVELTMGATMLMPFCTICVGSETAVFAALTSPPIIPPRTGKPCRERLPMKVFQL